METYFVAGDEVHEMTPRWAVVLLERAHEYLRHEHSGSMGERWQQYHDALCILENAIVELAPELRHRYID